MKWIGQEIYDLVSRFRSDVYLDGVSTSTETDMLVVDSNNKISKRAFSTFMTNGLDNRVLTATGANGINAEQYLMFDGTYGATFLFLQPIANTVTDCFLIDAHGLTTGSGIKLDIEDSLTTTANKSLINIDYDKSGITGSGIINAVTGLNVSLVDAATNHASSNTIATGVNVAIDAASDQGDIRQVGYSATLTDGDVTNTTGYYSNVEDGGIDFKAVSSADTGDMFTIATTTHGATTLTTTDDDATAAHFEIAADGNITLDSAVDIYLESADLNYLYGRTLHVENNISSHGTNVQVMDQQNSADERMSVFFTKDKGAAGADADFIYGIYGRADNAAQELTDYTKIESQIFKAADTDEAGILNLKVASSDGTTSALQSGLYLRGHGTNNDVDVTLGYGSTSETTVAGNLTVTSDLTVSGTTTTVNTTNLNIEDKNITLNYNASSDTSGTADGAGITIQDAVDASNDATILWTASSDTFTFSHNINATLATAAQTNITSVGNTLSIGNSTSDNAQLNIQNQTTDAEGGVLVFKKTKGLIGGILQTPNDDDEIGRTSYTYSDDASITEYDYARTVVTATDVSNGSESGKYQILASGQGSLRNVISGEGGSTSAEIDVTIANGSESVTTIAGSLTVTNDLTVNGGNATINGGDTTDAILKLATNTASASDDVIIELVTDEDGTPRQARIGVDHSDNTLKLVHGSGFSGGTNGICVDSSGNVGLGTASPEAHLHLESAGDTAIIVRADVGNSGEDDNPLIHLQQDFVAAGSSGVMVDGKLGIVGTAGQIMSSSIANSTYITAQGGGSSPNVSMQFGTGGNNGQDTDHAAVLPTARMTIRHDGKIGIGTNDPDSLLEIFGTSTQLKLSNNASDYASFAVGTHGNLTITTVDAAATAAHIELAADGNIVLDAAGDIALESGGSDVTSDARNFTISNGESSSPSLKLQSIKDDTSAAFFTFDKNRFLGAEEAGTADGDTLGTIQWTGTNDAMQLITYANIISTIAEVTDTDEAGKLTMQVAASNGTASTMQDGIVIEGTGTTRQANVTIGNAVDCTTTIAGNLMVTTGIELGHASDTTIARSAAGTVTIEGEQIATNIYSKKVVISQAEMNALALAPKELVAAPGSNKFIDVLSFNLIVDRASTNTVSAYLSCSYNGDSSLAGALFLRKSFMLNKTTDTYYPVMRYTTDAGNTDPINKSVTAQLQSAITSNCTTSTTVLITYSIIDAS